MIDDLRMRRFSFTGQGTSFWFALALAPLWLMLPAFLTGCQEEVKTTKATAVEKPPQISETTASTPTVEKPSAGRVETPVAGPRITFEETVHNFGEVAPESKHTTQFKFKNTGTAPLKIVSVRPCCGVTTKGVAEGQVYAPGQGGVLELEYPAAAQPGPVVKYIYITSNDPEQEIASLTFKAEIVPQVTCEPSSLRLFLKRENGGAGELTVTSVNKQPFSITSFRSTGNALTATFDPAAKDTKLVLKFSASVEKLKQHPRGRVEILLTHPDCKSLYIDYDVLPEFTVNPPQIIAFNLKPGEPIRKEIWILSNYGDDFEIDSVSSKNGTIKLLESEKVKASVVSVIGVLPTNKGEAPSGDQYQCRLKVEIVPPQERTPMSDELLVAIKGGETLSIAYQGYYGGN